MKETISIFTVESNAELVCRMLVQQYKEGIAIYQFDLSWNFVSLTEDSEFLLQWATPMLDIMFRWTPTCGTNRSIPPSWTNYYY